MTIYQERWPIQMKWNQDVSVKIVMRLSYLYNGNSNTWKDTPYIKTGPWQRFLSKRVPGTQCDCDNPPNILKKPGISPEPEARNRHSGSYNFTGKNVQEPNMPDNAKIGLNNTAEYITELQCIHEYGIIISIQYGIIQIPIANPLLIRDYTKIENWTQIRCRGRFHSSISKILQCIRQISHNTPFCNRNVHTCTFLLQNVALWNICRMHCGISVIGFTQTIFHVYDFPL